MVDWRRDDPTLVEGCVIFKLKGGHCQPSHQAITTQSGTLIQTLFSIPNARLSTRLHPRGAIFLTLVTFNRRPIFAEPDNIKRLRRAAATVKAEMPFDITAVVVLPDHIHFVWTLPPDDDHYSK
jgi:hypothetical protein